MRSPFIGAGGYSESALETRSGVTLAERHAATTGAEFRAVRRAAGVADRSDRVIVEVTGKDRASWAHGLVTNAVKTLTPGQGCYAFALDVKGRIQFDLNILCLAESLWLDLDRSIAATAIKYLESRLIIEDARLNDCTDRFARIGIYGPQSVAAAEQFGWPGFDPSPRIPTPIETASVTSEWSKYAATVVGDAATPTRLIRDDTFAAPGFEVVTPLVAAPALWTFAIERCGLPPIGFAALDVARIEAGIPWLGRDLDEKVLPPETNQIDRGVSYKKGCYVGQEVVERMRAHGVLARRLVKVRIGDGRGISLPAALRRGDAECGRITSLVAHPDGGWIGLGYLKNNLPDTSGISVAATTGEIAVTIE